MLEAEYIAAGANRHPCAADWISSPDDPHTSPAGQVAVNGKTHDGGILAFGSGRNIALWRGGAVGSEDGNRCRLEKLLVGHTDTVNAVKFLRVSAGRRLLLISGSVDKSVRVWWQRRDQTPLSTKGGEILDFECVQALDGHQSSINCIAVASGVDFFATGAADATVKIWKVELSAGEKPVVNLLQSIELRPRYFPLALALTPLARASDSYLLAAAGTAATVQIYVADASEDKSLDFTLQATLSGHEGWIRSLSFTHENEHPDSDLLLASASQDKYIRLWRVHQGKKLPAAVAAGGDPALGAFLPGKSLSNKAHRFKAAGKDYSATFEALLLGHEDWIYSAIWKSSGNTLQLLSASADNSLSIWEQDPSSSVWISVARLGEISAQKGSTTATGSTGGFWTGLWSPSGQTVACIGRTGSWRLWTYNSEHDRWVQVIGISGHTQAVTGIAWSRNGDYLLSTSSDQTTRLHAKWNQNGHSTWHEMARPQIHGYDLNCIDTLGDLQFVSGADEKLLRVFKEPKAVADLLQKLCGIFNPKNQSLPDAANMPVLGLSNKAISTVDPADTEDPTTGTDTDAIDLTSIAHRETLDLAHPPLEDHLSKHTLWPEIEKLYGHGYEISALAASHDGSVIATACKASSLEHAVIRLFETTTWTEVKPPLTAHSLTVTHLRFSSDDRYLLSVGRDRQWGVFERAGGSASEDGERVVYASVEVNPKAHSRMILDAAWAPVPVPHRADTGASTAGARTGARAFMTAGRDKSVKLWGWQDGGEADKSGAGRFVHRGTIVEEAPVTAVDFMDTILNDNGGDDNSVTASTTTAYLALGTEAGRLSICRVDLERLVVLEKFVVGVSSCPSKAITQLSWRPSRRNNQEVTNGTDTGTAIYRKEISENDSGGSGHDDEIELAVASEDCSLRIYALKTLLAASTSDAGVC